MKNWARPVIYGALALFVAAAVYLIYRPPFKPDPVPPEPAYQAPKVKERSLGQIVDREAKPGDRIPGDVSTRLKEAKHPNDVSALISVAMDVKDDDAARNEAVNLLRRSGYKELTNRLVMILENPKDNPRFRAFCVQQLWMNLKGADEAERKRILAVMYRHVDDPEVPVRREALLALVRERDELGKTKTLEWLAKPGDDTVDLSIHCAYDLELKDQLPSIRQHLKSRNEAVRIAAIVVLSQWRDEESRPAFEEAAKSKVVRLQRAGKAALERIDAKGAQP